MTYFSGVNARQPTYDAIIKKTFTEIYERPSRRQRDNLLVEVEKVLVGVSVPVETWYTHSHKDLFHFDEKVVFLSS